jgi:hypothetical protein
MSNDKKNSPVIAQKVEIEQKGNSTTLVQNAGVINNYINNGGKVEVDSRSSGEKTPQTITVKPNTEQQQPKIDWRNVLPDFQQEKVKEIFCNPETLDLHKVVGVPMVDIENREKLKQGKTEVTTPSETKDNKQKPTATTVALNTFTGNELKALASKTGDVDNDSPKLREEVSRELQNDGIAKNVNGKPRINVEALKQYNPKLLSGTDGKTLDSLDQDKREYIQTILGVKPDGVVGPITLGTAQKKGILNVDGTVNAEKLKEATINAAKLQEKEKEYWNKTIQGNIAEENAKKNQKPTVLDDATMNFISSAMSGVSQSWNMGDAVVPSNDGNAKTKSNNHTR